MKWELPPKAKIYEALSAVAGNRVKLLDATKAEVTSSSGDKKYTVQWAQDGKAVTSNDNASHWQGYLGYPILAVWMLRGEIQYDRDVARHLAGVPWKRLNTQFRNKYDQAIEHVLKDIESQGVSRETITSEVNRIAEQVSHLSLERHSSNSQKSDG